MDLIYESQLNNNEGLSPEEFLPCLCFFPLPFFFCSFVLSVWLLFVCVGASVARLTSKCVNMPHV